MTYFNDLNPFLVRQDTPTQPTGPTGPNGMFLPTGMTASTGMFNPTGSTGTTGVTGGTNHTGTNGTNKNGAGVPPTSSGTPTPPLTPPPIIDQTYIENILRINIGKSGRFYFSYDDSEKWRDQLCRGVIEQAGRDHFIVHDPTSGIRYLLQLVYLDWVEFDEEVNYQVPYV